MCSSKYFSTQSTNFNFVTSAPIFFLLNRNELVHRLPKRSCIDMYSIFWWLFLKLIAWDWDFKLFNPGWDEGWDGVWCGFGLLQSVTMGLVLVWMDNRGKSLLPGTGALTSPSYKDNRPASQHHASLQQWTSGWPSCDRNDLWCRCGTGMVSVTWYWRIYVK